ncbi:hypothetical protein [Actinosynnema sp. NPDC000082]|uniref:hypothetical protein n=1 Tax=Actinosynnema sp. NPDC000082 TaxID=3363910 RepID=UPI0036AA33C7|nr:putative anti-sigma-YlaC factor YlaD, contains Zn-finger domain [Actinosynnema pretiosum]
MPSVWVDAHLEGCSACRGWQAGALALTRAVRVRPAAPTPDLVAAVLADAPARRVAVLPRVALAGTGLVQLWLALAQLLTGATGGPHGGHGAASGLSDHLFNEGTAWNLALGAGLLVAAVDSRRAAGLLPTLAGFVPLLLAFSAHDLLEGSATAERVVSHLPLVVGLALLVVVARAHRERPAPNTPAVRDREDSGGGPGLREADGPPPPPSRAEIRHLWPAGRHDAA